MFTQGNLMILENNFDSACKTFLVLHKSDTSNAHVNYKVGVCYLHLPGEKGKAIPYLQNAIRQTKGNFREDDPSEKNAPEEASYCLAQAYHYNYQFDEALVQYNKFREGIGKWNLNLVKEVDHNIEESKNGKDLFSKPLECTITNLGDNVNCPFADYSPVISADEEILAFTSRREGTGGPDYKTFDGDFYEDIWICYRGEYGTWQKAKSIGPSINTEGNEATIGLSADGQQLYIYKADENNKDGNIFISKLDGNFWTPANKIEDEKINSKSWEPSACISADGNSMYFVSNRPGGFGGRDIYQCHRLPNRGWSDPENLGPSINTPYDEDAPFIHPDGITFFFSSKGHNSMGGFDVFYSTKVSNTVWTPPVNMGYPLNTTDDDIYFVTSSDGRRGYYASFRPEGKGEKDIYMVSLPKAFVRSVAILVGYLKNKDGSPIPKSSSIITKGADGQVLTSKPNEATGKFIQSLLPGQKYEINISANNNNIYSDTFFLPEDSSYQAIGRSFFQKTIYIGDSIHLFSMHKIADLSPQIQMVPMNGAILLSKDTNNAAGNITVEMLNLQGNILASTVTDSKGKFKFQNIPSNQKYILKINENESILKSNKQFYLASNEGKIIMSSTQEGRFFLFKNVAADINKTTLEEVKDTTLIAMSGKIASGNNGKKIIPNVNINLLDSQGKIIQTKSTDYEGNFSFENIQKDKNYSLSINANTLLLKNNLNLFLLNKKAEIIKKIARNGDYFIFANLPADLNKLSSINISDTAALISMKGKILKSFNPSDGIGNLEFTLSNNKGKIIQRSKTDANGTFRFEKLSADNNYTIKFNEQEPLFAGLKNVYLANEAGKIIKVIEVNKNVRSLKNLPADLMKLEELKDILVIPVKDSINLVNKNNIHPGDEQFDFVVYFPYNKKEIDISVGSFLSLMEKVSKTINEKGNATISIAASSSSVPTKSFTSNEALSEMRAKEIKDKVRASMGLRNLDAAKITYNISAKVLGPVYKNDAMQNRKEYEKWQFVKVLVK